MSALDVQVGGAHYKNMPIQPMVYCQKNQLNACESAVIQYVSRWKDKGGVQDLRKAIHCIELLIEIEELEKKPDTAPTVKLPEGMAVTGGTIDGRAMTQEEIERAAQQIVNGNMRAVAQALEPLNNDSVASDLYASDRRANEPSESPPPIKGTRF